MKHINLKKLGKVIRSARDAKFPGVSRLDVCAKLGLSHPTLVKLESGKHLPNVLTINKIINLFGESRDPILKSLGLI